MFTISKYRHNIQRDANSDETNVKNAEERSAGLTLELGYLARPF